jgi:hypothetical protein
MLKYSINDKFDLKFPSIYGKWQLTKEERIVISKFGVDYERIHIYIIPQIVVWIF